MSIVVVRDDDSHLTTKPDLSSTRRILQADLKELPLLGNVVVYDVDGYLQLAVAWQKVQLAKTEQEETTRNVQTVSRSSRL